MRCSLGALSSQCTGEISAFDMVLKKDGSRYCLACGNGEFTATPSFYTAPQLFTVGDTDEDGDRTEEREQIGSQSSRIPPKDTKDHDSRWYEGCRAMTTRGTPSYLVRLPSSPRPPCMGDLLWLSGKGLALALVGRRRSRSETRSGGNSNPCGTARQRRRALISPTSGSSQGSRITPHKIQSTCEVSDWRRS